jgi:hypothetical protein
MSPAASTSVATPLPGSPTEGRPQSGIRTENRLRFRATLGEDLKVEVALG